MMVKHLLYHERSPTTKLVGSFSAFSLFLAMTSSIFEPQLQRLTTG